jgi:hypothetical protein
MNRSTVIGFVCGLALCALVALGVGAAAPHREVGQWQGVQGPDGQLILVETATGDSFVRQEDSRKGWVRVPGPVSH